MSNGNAGRSIWYGILAVAILLAPVAVFGGLATTIRGIDSPCRPTKVAVDGAAAPTVAAGAPQVRSDNDGSAKVSRGRRATLNLREEEDTTVSFGRSLGTKRVDIWLDLRSPAGLRSGSRLRLDVGDLKRADDAQIGSHFLHANARVLGNQVRLRVCVKRTNPGDIHPGTYSGRVTFLDQRVEPYALPFSITMAYPVWPWPALLLYAVVLVAFVYVWALKTRPSGDEPMVSREAAGAFLRWAGTWSGVFALGLGLVAAVTAFLATYLSSADWGSSVTQVFGLVGAVFTAFVTAATLSRDGGTAGGRGAQNRAERSAGARTEPPAEPLS